MSLALQGDFLRHAMLQYFSVKNNSSTDVNYFCISRNSGLTGKISTGIQRSERSVNSR